MYYVGKYSRFLNSSLSIFYTCIHTNPSVHSSMNHSRENILYNQETLSKYYGMLLTACKQISEVHEVWMEAPNFLWALGSMIFGDFYQEHVRGRI